MDLAFGGSIKLNVQADVMKWVQRKVTKKRM